MTTALAILQRARSKLASRESWGKGQRGHDRLMTTCCVAEAIEEADPTFMKMERRRAFRAFANAAAIPNFDDPGFPRAMVDWNDDPEREHADVVKGFNLAIATLSLGSPIRTAASANATQHAEAASARNGAA